MHKITLTLDDFSVLNNHLSLLWQLREKFDGFKVSLFTVPDDIKHKDGNREEALVRIKECLDWIQIIPHGIQHNSSEARLWDYQTTQAKLEDIKKIFDKDGLPFERGFKAPHWHWNESVVQALDDAGWWGAVSPKVPKMARTKRFYIHDHSINENFYYYKDLKLQGHLNGTSPDDLRANIHRLLRMPGDIEWHYATDYIQEQ